MSVPCAWLGSAVEAQELLDVEVHAPPEDFAAPRPSFIKTCVGIVEQLLHVVLILVDAVVRVPLCQIVWWMLLNLVVSASVSACCCC